MRYLAAYLLAQLGGTSRPQESDIKNILNSVGIECEQERVNLVVSQMHGKNMHDLINAGKEKMGGLSFGVAPAAASVATAASAPSEATKPESKAPAAPVEEKEESEESDADMGFSLFD